MKATFFHLTILFWHGAQAKGSYEFIRRATGEVQILLHATRVPIVHTHSLLNAQEKEHEHAVGTMTLCTCLCSLSRTRHSLSSPFIVATGGRRTRLLPSHKRTYVSHAVRLSDDYGKRTRAAFRRHFALLLTTPVPHHARAPSPPSPPPPRCVRCTMAAKTSSKCCVRKVTVHRLPAAPQHSGSLTVFSMFLSCTGEI